MTRTPDEVKKGLGYHGWTLCDKDCPYGGFKGSGYDCSTELCGDALVLIQQLEAQNAELSGKIGQLEGKLDEAINDLHKAVNCPATLVACEFCKNNEVRPHDGTCDAVENDRWQWRGITKEGH